MRPAHRHMLRRVIETTKEHGPILHLCFTPGTPDDIVQAFEDAVFGVGGRFQLTGRWTNTALPQPSYAQGQPVTLTYSFVPDGTFVPDLIGTRATATSSRSSTGSTATRPCGSPSTTRCSPAGPNSPAFVHLRAQRRRRRGSTTTPASSACAATSAWPPSPRRQQRRPRVQQLPQRRRHGARQRRQLLQQHHQQLAATRNILSHEHGHGQGILHVCPRERPNSWSPSSP